MEYTHTRQGQGRSGIYRQSSGYSSPHAIMMRIPHGNVSMVTELYVSFRDIHTQISGNARQDGPADKIYIIDHMTSGGSCARLKWQGHTWQGHTGAQ